MKEGKIDDTGCLHIKRAGKWVEQYCKADKTHLCSHACPFFGEPMPVRSDSAHLTICENTVLYFERFTDEREE